MLARRGSAGNPPATCDVAGAGNQLTVRIVRHSQRKRGAMDRPNLRSNGASPRPYRVTLQPPYLELERSSSAYVHIDFLFAFTISLAISSNGRRLHGIAHSRTATTSASDGER
jgi:hypothetical protein